MTLTSWKWINQWTVTENPNLLYIGTHERFSIEVLRGHILPSLKKIINLFFKWNEFLIRNALFKRNMLRFEYWRKKRSCISIAFKFFSPRNKSSERSKRAPLLSISFAHFGWSGQPRSITEISRPLARVKEGGVSSKFLFRLF